MSVIKDIAASTLALAKKYADESEVYLHQQTSLKIDILNNKPESTDSITETGLAVRLIKNKKLGFAYTADLNESALEDCVSQAAANLVNSPEDEFVSLPEPKKQTVPAPTIDPQIARTKMEDKVKLAIETERSAYASDNRIKKSGKIFYEDVLSRTVLINSKGVQFQHDKTICGAFADVIAEENGLMETGSWVFFSTKFKDIDPSAIGKEAAKRAVDMLGAKPEKSGKASVILSPLAGSILLSSLFPALSAESAQKGKSLFSNAMEKPVASRKLTLLDSGILLNGLSSVPYDDEGTPTKETAIIKEGYLKSFMHDCYTAKKGKTVSTGNAFRSSFKVVPEVQPTNFYVKPGTKPQTELIDSLSKGFLVTNIMGAHTINPISGDFSIGFAGFFIENGKISRPVRGMTLSGNLLDIFSHIEEIGSDLMFFPHSGNIGSPSILIANISVSGI